MGQQVWPLHAEFALWDGAYGLEVFVDAAGRRVSVAGRPVTLAEQPVNWCAEKPGERGWAAG
ncbi:hypothetical protein [Actinokineospora cianjurensis]|uniref:hypothetical protein n=1 Tax=Actinokineospora cianjurensis TaxID=585224 RepID=UPI0011C3DA6D|nr:hypothetical protein [Actinokineospora cianjurensis]